MAKGYSEEMINEAIATGAQFSRPRLHIPLYLTICAGNR